MAKNQYTSGEYIDKYPTYHVEDSAWKMRDIFKLVTKHELHPGTVAEIGCGAGEILHLLQSKLRSDTEIRGYDISPHAIGIANQRANEHLHFHVKDLIAEENTYFDLLLCIDVFEHIEDYMGFLRNLKQKAANIIFHIPLDMSVQMVLRSHPMITTREKAGHLHYFSKDTALATLRDTGYEVVDWLYTCAAIERPESGLTSLANIPRKLFFHAHQDLTARVLGRYSLMVLTR